MTSTTPGRRPTSRSRFVGLRPKTTALMIVLLLATTAIAAALSAPVGGAASEPGVGAPAMLGPALAHAGAVRTSPPIPLTPAPTAPTSNKSLRLFFTGDVLMHSPLWSQAARNGSGGAFDFTPMFADIRPMIENADLAVCHLETPIAPPGEAYSTDPRYGVPAEVIDAVAAVGFDHCSTASNHTFDRGVAGVDATANRFDQLGITQRGMARTPAEREPILLHVGGVTIGHISATYGFDLGVRPVDQPWRSNLIDPQSLIDDARLARERGADLVVVSLHWGNSGSHQASVSQRAIAEQLAASGQIDLVIGHHAHVVQPIEQVGSMWVAYGLGDFVSNMPPPGSIWTEDTRDGIVVEIDIVDVDAPSGPRFTTPVAHPIWVDKSAGWVVRDVAAALARPDLVARVGGELVASWKRTTAVVGAWVPPL